MLKKINRDNKNEIFLVVGVVLGLIYILCTAFFVPSELEIGSFTFLALTIFLFSFTTKLLKETRTNITIVSLDIFVLLWYLYGIIHSVYSGRVFFEALDFYLNSTLLGVYCTFRIFALNENLRKIIFTIVSIILLIFGCIQGIIYLIQLSGASDIVNKISYNAGSFAGIASFAVFMALVFLFAVWHIVNTPTKRNTIQNVLFYISLFLFFLLLFISPQTQNRTCWIMMAVGSGIILFYKYREKIRMFFRRKWILFFSICLIVVLSLGALYYLYNYKKDSADGRLIVWKVTLQAAIQKPLLGYGNDVFFLKYLDWQSEWFNVQPRTSEEIQLADKVVRCYNDFLLEFVEKGVLGLTLLLVLFLASILCIVKITETHKSLLLAVILCIGLSSLITFSLSLPFILLCFFACLALIANEQKEISNFTINSRILILLVGIIVIINLILGISAIKQHYEIEKKYEEIRFLGNDYESILQKSEKDISMVKNDRMLLSSYIIALYNSGKYNTCADYILVYNLKTAESGMYDLLGDCYTKLHEYEKAEIAYKREYSMIPNRFLPLYKLHTIYKQSGQKQKATKIAEEIINKEIKVQSPAIREMQAEMHQYLNKQ